MEENTDGPRFRGYELPVYAWRIAAAGARLCRQAGRALWHYPRAMGAAGQGGAQRGPEAVGTGGTDGNAADHADAADRSPVRQWLDRTPRLRYRPPRQPALSAQGRASVARQAGRTAFRADGDRARGHQSHRRPPPARPIGNDQGKRAQRDPKCAGGTSQEGTALWLIRY